MALSYIAVAVAVAAVVLLALRARSRMRSVDKSHQALLPADCASLSEVPVVLVPGLYGSHLLRDSRQLFLTLPIATGLSSPDLALPIGWDAEGAHQHKDGVRAPSVVEGIDLLGCIPLQKLCTPLMRALRAQGREVHTFSYDWRRCLDETERAFSEWLDDQFSGTPVQLIAFSTGGLVTLPHVKRKPQLFHSAAFVGCPFGPGMEPLQMVHAGAAIGMNHRICDRRTLFTHGLLQHFLPDADSDEDLRDMREPLPPELQRVLDAAGAEGARFVGLFDADGQPIACDLHDAACWTKLGLSVFADGHPPSVDEMTHLRHVLRHAKAYRQTLRAPPSSEAGQMPLIGVMRNTGLPTTVALKLTRAGDLELICAPGGDGVVSGCHTLPAAVEVEHVAESDRVHRELLTDAPTLVQLLAALHESSLTRGPGGGARV